MSTSWPSSSAGERKADFLSQQRMGQHCGNSRQIGSNWRWGEIERKWEGLFQLSGVKIYCSFHLFSVRSPRSPLRALSEGFPWFHRGSISGAFSHMWQSASCNTVSYKKQQEQPLVSVVGFITLKFPSQLRSLFWACQEKHSLPIYLLRFFFFSKQECHGFSQKSYLLVPGIRILAQWLRRMTFQPGCSDHVS